jgi:hypothetical protein
MDTDCPEDDEGMDEGDLLNVDGMILLPKLIKVGDSAEGNGEDGGDDGLVDDYNNCVGLALGVPVAKINHLIIIDAFQSNRLI